MGKQSVALILLTALLAACGQPSHDPRTTAAVDPGEQGGGEITGQRIADFAEMQKIFTANRCMKCHSEATEMNGNVRLLTYADAKFEAIRIRDSVNSDFMPRGNPKMSAEDKALISKWVDLGAPEKFLDFPTVKAAIFTPHCVRCHAEFNDYVKVAAILPQIKAEVDTNRMPRRAPPLTDDLKAMLSEWINQGALEVIPARGG